MTFKFTYLCELLEDLEKPPLKVPRLPKPLKEYTETTIKQWFKRYRARLNRNDTESDAVACMLRPEIWVDREYFGGAENLEPLLSKVLGLSDTERVELHKWKTAYYTGDLGTQVERLWAIKRNPERMIYTEVTVEDIDQFFLRTAAHNSRSSLEVQSLQHHCPAHDPEAELKGIFERLRPQQAKWMTRLLLKTTEPVKIPESFLVKPDEFGFSAGVKPFPFELSSTPPTTLRFGSKRVPAKKSVVSSTTLRSTNTIARRRSPTPEGHGSPEVDLRPRERGRRNTRGLMSINRPVSKPRTTKYDGNVVPDSIPTPPSSLPKPVAQTPNTSGKSATQPAAKRRRMSEDDFPIFKRGYLQHGRSAEMAQGTILTPRSSLPTPAPNKYGNSGTQAVDERRRSSRDSFPEFKIGYLQHGRPRETILTPPSSLPTPLSPVPIISENSDSPPVAKRQRISSEKETSILKPMRETNITNNRSLNKNLANTTATRDSLSQEKSPGNPSSFLLANSSQLRLPPVSNPASAHVLPSNDSQGHQRRSKVSSPKAILEDKKHPKRNLSTTTSSHTILHSPSGKMDANTQTTKPLTQDVGIQVKPADIPKPSTETPLIPSIVINSPTPELQIPSTTTSNSPLTIGGTGLCTHPTTSLSTHCPLATCIFLPSPYLPTAIIDHLKTTLFPLHGCRCITNLNELGHPSLPRGCRATKTMYRKIVLVEPEDEEATERVKGEVKGLGLRNKKGRKDPVEVFDWRLLETVGGREWDRDGENPWNVCFVTVK